MSEQFRLALVRALAGGIVSAGSVFFSLIGSAGVERAGIAAGAAFFGVLAARGFGDGGYHTGRGGKGSASGAGWLP